MSNVQYYVEKDDRSDIWKKVTNGGRVDWYKNGIMRFGGPDMSKVSVSDSHGNLLNSSFGSEMERKLTIEAATVRSEREASRRSRINNANTTYNDLRNRADSLLDGRGIEDKVGNHSTDEESLRTKLYSDIARFKKNNDIREFDDKATVIKEQLEAAKVYVTGSLQSAAPSTSNSSPNTARNNKQDKIHSSGQLKDSDKDGIANKYDIWDGKDGVPNSINSRSELNNAKNKLENKLKSAKANGNDSLNNDIRELERNLATVNNRLNNLPKSSTPASDSSNKVLPGEAVVAKSKPEIVAKGKQADGNGFLTRYGDAETAQKALYATVDAIAKADPGAVREFGTRGTAGYYVELKTKDGWVSGNSNKAVNQLTKYAPSKEEAATLPALATVTSAAAVQTKPVEAGQLMGVQLAEKANFAASKPLSYDIDLGEAAKKSRAIIAAADMNSDGKLTKPEAALYNPADRNGNGKIGAKEASKFIGAADTNKSGVISAEESKAYAVLDTNNNGKLGKKEFAAYKEIDANGDGDITSDEAQRAYSAKVVTTQDKRTHQLAKEFLDKNLAKSGAQAVDTQVAALAGVQVAATTVPTPEPDVTMPAPAVIAPSAAVAAPAAIIAAADRNDNGVVSAAEQAKFEALADADASGEVSTVEAQAFALIDSNENGKIGKKELAAFRAIDKNGDGNLTAKEAKAALKAQIDSVQDKRTHDLAKDYLAKNPGNGGGSDEVDAAAAALVNAGRTESSLKKEAAAKKSKK